MAATRQHAKIMNRSYTGESDTSLDSCFQLEYDYNYETGYFYTLVIMANKFKMNKSGFISY